MSSQAGVVNQNGRRVPEDLAEAIGRSLAAADHVVPRIWVAAGVCMVHADFPLRDEMTAQPYFTGRCAITFDGRLDNREELLLLLGDDLRGEESDAALALAAYERWGVDGLSRLQGDWSLAIWNYEKKQLVLASDFAGARPLYYAVDGERILWATDLRSLVRWVRPSGWDEQYVAGFLSRGCPGRTPYRGIFSLVPGRYLTASRDGIRIQSHWRPPVGASIRYRRESDCEERLRELFGEAVRCRLRTDFPVLSELSGGLDSSSIVCETKRLADRGEARTPLIRLAHYDQEQSVDEPFYELVRKWSGFESERISTATHRYAAEGRVGVAQPGIWEELHSEVAEAARRIGARTLLTGGLGDLILANWRDDSTQAAGMIRAGRIVAAVRESFAWSMALRIPVWGVMWRALLSALPAELVESRPELYGEGPAEGQEQEDLLTPEFRARTGDSERPDPFSRDWMQARPEMRKLTRALIETLEVRRFQPPEPLTHLYCTHPFTHRPLVEFMLSIPPGVACRPGEPRRLMRRALGPFWPPELRKRRSKGPFGGAFLTALKPLAAAMLRDVAGTHVVRLGWVDAVRLRRRLERLGSPQEANAGQLRRLILLETWLRGRGPGPCHSAPA